jgi:hypothetical protein
MAHQRIMLYLVDSMGQIFFLFVVLFFGQHPMVTSEEDWPTSCGSNFSAGVACN